MRLPEWHRLHARITSWEPSSGRIEVTVSVAATSVTIRSVTVNLEWPHKTDAKPVKQRSDSIEPGKTWVGVFESNLKSGSSGWVEVIVSALPDLEDLRELIKSSDELSSHTKNLLKHDIENLRAPLSIGKGFAFYADSEIAVFTLPQLVFSPAWPVGGRAVFLWIPEGELGSDELKKAFGDFKAAVRVGKAEKALEHVEKAIEILAESHEPVSLETDETSVLIPIDSLNRSLESNRVVLQAIIDKGNPKSIERFLKSEKPGFCDGFLWASIGSLYSSSGNQEAAETAYRRALRLIPTWPLVLNWSKR